MSAPGQPHVEVTRPSSAGVLGALAALGARWPLAAVGLLLEYLGISLRVDALALHGRGLYGFEYLGSLATGILVMFAATVVLRGRALLDDLAAVRVSVVDGLTWALLALHAASYAALWWLSVHIFDSPPDRPIGGGFALAWLAAAAMVVLSVVPLVAKLSRLPALLRTLAPSLGLGLVAGLLGVGFGYASSQLWNLIGHFTLDASAWLLGTVVPDVIYVPGELIFGTPEFVVHLAPACSGFEGMGLIFALLSGYIFVNRAELRFPQVLAVVPLGMIAVWLANTARIAALVLLGAYWSPAVAVGGFHSKAGWVLFCAIAMAAVALIRHIPALSDQTATASASAGAVDEDQAAPYLLPLLVLIGVSLLTGLAAVEVDFLYGLRIVGAAAALFVFRADYRRLLAMPGWESVVIGVLVYVLWAAMVPGESEAGARLHGEVAAAGGLSGILFIASRVLGSTLVVPVVEELAFRGYLLPRLVSRRFESVALSRPHWVPLLVSSLAFGFLHGAWLAGTAAGIAYGLAQVRRGRTVDAIAAHAVTNGLICVQVLALDHWALWA